MDARKLGASYGLSGIIEQINHDRSRWFFWFPAAVAVGIAVYFDLKWHPSQVWLFATPTVALTLVFSKNIPYQLMRTFLFFALAVSLGFSASIVREKIISAPVLQKKHVTGLRAVILKKSSGISSRRLLLGDLIFENQNTIPDLKYIRLTARMLIDHLQPGQIIETRAVLLPPPAPAYPGGFDFQRHSYFQSIGAVGYSIDDFRVVGVMTGPGESLPRLSAYLRAKIADIVKKLAPINAAGFITAISTGDKGAIPDQQIDDMRHSGLAHLLAISGLHMGMIGGLIFFSVRLLLALWPYITLNYPIKKIAAIIALLGLTGYLFVSGMSVSATRAYIMISALFLAICFDRTALSFRMVVLAALIILLVFPESLTTASFQMSFAAVFALISLYETVGPRLGQFARSGGVFKRIIAYFLGIIGTSLVAGLATAPFAIYHFGQVAAYSLIANLLAVPLMGIWVMPWGIVAFLTMPLQISFPFEMMGLGINLILWIAGKTSDWPDAVQYLGTFSTLKLSLIALVCLWFMIWKSPIRWAAVPVLFTVFLLYKPLAPPDILVSQTGNLYAVRLSEEKLYLSSKRVEKFEAARWQLLFGPILNVTSSSTVKCDPYGCVYVKDAQVLAFPTAEQALKIDCDRATLVISRVPVKRTCAPARVIDKFDLWRNGAHSIWLKNFGALRVDTVNGLRGNRPWVPTRYKIQNY